MDDSQYATIDEIKNFSPVLKEKILQVKKTAEAPKKRVPPPPPQGSSAIQLEYLQEEPPPLPPLPPPNNHRHHSFHQQQKNSSPPHGTRSPMLKARSLDVKTKVIEPEEPCPGDLKPKAGEGNKYIFCRLTSSCLLYSRSLLYAK